MPLRLDIKSTHRGPLIDKDIMSLMDILLSEDFPMIVEMGSYSFAWAGTEPKDNYLTFVR